MPEEIPLIKTEGLKEWSLDPDFSVDSRFADVNIHLKYVDVETLIQFEPKERKKRIKEDQQEKFDQLIRTNLFDNYEIIETSKIPRGIKTRIAFSILNDIESLDYVCNIFINKIDGARKKRQKKVLSFYCVKMTVVVEIEGIEDGLQTVEDRLVIIQAKSQEDAYLKLEQKKHEYSVPYLNSDGRFVRWRIESFDDYFEIGINKMNDFNDPGGVEVYSKLRSRRLKKGSAWDGRSK